MVYDVFVSFRGRDTRYKFTDHLFAALDRSGIRNFKDNRKIARGKDIWPELEKAIQESRIAVIVFSENYADSRWCLEELAKIMECKRNLQQIVLPVFYGVDPSHVRNQKGSLKKAFDRHVSRFKVDVVERWRAALNEVGNLAGWDSQDVEHSFESKFIGKIIEEISGKINERADLTVASYPVGIESRRRQLDELLSKYSTDVCMVGIWGIGGIGKTTIARVIYNQLQSKFEARCFLENVGEIAKQSQGMVDLQNQILSSLHVIDNSKVECIALGTTEIRTRAWCNRVLVVLDDVDHQDQLDQLAIRRGDFQPGSIIIITTRDKSLFNLDEINEIYMPPPLDYHESIQLLSWHAFGIGQPKENYVELSKEVIYYARGLPLTLKVLGSYLSNMSITEWRGTLERLRLIPNEEIQNKIEVCFDSLSDTQKELFLDIACFFVGMKKYYVFKILQDSNSILESDLGVLVRRCLVIIETCSERLTMHDIIRDMGREIVRKKSPKFPGKRCRLWFHEDVIDVLQHNEGTDSVEGIMLNFSEAQNLRVESKAFVNMQRLRVLQLNYAQLQGNFQCLSKRLRYLEWYGFPLESIPPDLHMENLVAIYMPYSMLIELWKGAKILGRLKFLDFSHSPNLKSTPDFSKIINLEVLVLNNCNSLVEVHESVIRLDKLVTFDLTNCENLELPHEIDKFMKRVNDKETGLKPKSPSIRQAFHILQEKLQDYIFRFMGKQRCGKPRHSENAAAHHPSLPQSPMKEQATFVDFDINVLNTPTFTSQLEALALPKLDTRVVRQLIKILETLNFSASHLHLLKREHDFFSSRFTNLVVEDLKNYERLLETKPKIIKFGATHGLMTGTPLPLPLPQLQLSPGVPVQDRTIQISFLRPILTLSTASIAGFHLSVVIDFIDKLKLASSSCRTLLTKQLSKGLEAMDENIATFLEWIFLNHSELLKKSPAKLFEELVATISISCFLSPGEFPEWFEQISTGSILYFVVEPPPLKQEIRGWLLCVEFAARFHDIDGFDIIYTFKNKTKGIEWPYEKKNCRVKPSQKHVWLHSVPLHDIVHTLEARDLVEFSIQVSGSFQLTKFGVNLIYCNYTECCQSKFEEMIQNVPLPRTDDFLDEVASIYQALLAGDMKISFFNLQDQVRGSVILKKIKVRGAVILPKEKKKKVRRVDTRTDFMAHPFDNFKSGEEIAPELLKAIETSRIAFMFLSKNYATSNCCLDELDVAEA